MQYTYEEAVRELSDFLGKHVTVDNFWKMEQILLTVLREVEVSESEYDIGYKDGYEEGVSKGIRESEEDAEESYQAGYKDGTAEVEQSVDDAFQKGYDEGYEAGVAEERDSWSSK